MLNLFGKLHKKFFTEGLIKGEAVQKKGGKHLADKWCYPEESSCCCSCCCNRTRYFILLLALLCMSVVRCNEMLFNMTVICMTRNDTAAMTDPVSMTSEDISIIFASSAVGVAVFSLPVAYLLHRFGTRLIFTTLMLISAMATAAMPPATQLGLPFIVSVRFAQGLALAAVMPMIGSVSSRWAPFTELGLFVTVLSMTGQISQMFTMPLAAHFCVTAGWPYAFYSHALLSLLFAITFATFYRNSPTGHPFVLNKEFLKTTEGNGNFIAKIKKARDVAIPYRSIVSSPAVWAVWIAFFGNAFGFQFIVRFMAIYFNKVLDVPIERTGLSAMVPAASQLVVKLILSATADHINCFNERLKLQFFNTLSMVGCGLWLVPLGFLGRKEDTMALVCFTASISCIAFETCGSMKSATLIARNFTQFLMAVSQLFSTIGMVLIPLLVGWLTPTYTIQEWRLVVLTIATVHILANFVFCVLCSDKPENWAFTDVDDRNTSILTSGTNQKNQHSCSNHEDIEKRANIKREKQGK